MSASRRKRLRYHGGSLPNPPFEWGCWRVADVKLTWWSAGAGRGGISIPDALTASPRPEKLALL
jgi:hypothetical protein